MVSPENQTTLFDEGSGWWRESRRHHDAALKGARGHPQSLMLPAPRPLPQPKIERCAICGSPGKYRIHEGPYKGGLKCEYCASAPCLAKDHVIELGPPSQSDRAQGGPPTLLASSSGELPPLQPGQKYQVLKVFPGGYVEAAARTIDPTKALKEGKLWQLLMDKTNPGTKVEIIPARDVNEARQIRRDRGKTDYLVTGDRHLLHDQNMFLKNDGLKWDYLSKGYRGKLSPEEVEGFRKKGLTVGSSTEFSYEEQREARIAKAENKAVRYEGWAEKAQARGEARLETAHRIGDTIPFGQPILVGHHSERHARADAARIDSNTRKGVEELKKAESLEQRAEGALAQAYRVRGSAAARDQQHRDRVRPMLRPGTRVTSSNSQYPLVIVKVNQKTARVRSEGTGNTYTEDLLYMAPTKSENETKKASE